MGRLLKGRPVWHAVIWIVLYLLSLVFGAFLSAYLSANDITGIWLLLLAVMLTTYLQREGVGRRFGLCLPMEGSGVKTLLYIPLLILALFPLVSGFGQNLNGKTVYAALLLALGTGFLEEVIFRGLLLQAIARRHGIDAGILISGMIFGGTHLIITLFQGGSILQQLEQLVLSVVLGIMLAILVMVTHSLLPGIAFHVAFYFTGAITADTVTQQPFLLAAFLTGVLFYGLWLMYSWKINSIRLS